MAKTLFFINEQLSSLFESLKNQIVKEITTCDKEYFINVDESKYKEYLLKKYSLVSPMLKMEELYSEEPIEIDVDVRGRFDYAIEKNSHPVYVKGTAVTICVPFDGDKELLNYSPTFSTSGPPMGEVVDNEIHLTYGDVKLKQEDLRNKYHKDIEIIDQHLKIMGQNINTFNTSLPQFIGEKFNQRKSKILEGESLVTSLGIPIKRRKDSSLTYSVPEVRRKPKIERPEAANGNQYDPTLSMEEYEHILKVINDMTMVIEKSPKAFAHMEEEELRSHYLVQLNGHYEGQATGETFNYQGKTDILIQHKGHNLFIAECKFWKGPEGLLETIDQLLKYTTWRGTKTAIILFNKNQNFSAILGKISETVKSHQWFKEELRIENQTMFIYKILLPSDKSRELYLTVMAFDMPKL